jgi:hypothetical protein
MSVFLTHPIGFKTKAQGRRISRRKIGSEKRMNSIMKTLTEFQISGIANAILKPLRGFPSGCDLTLARSRLEHATDNSPAALRSSTDVDSNAYTLKS